MKTQDPIPEEEQLSSDFDWFAVDSLGSIGHFTSAGFKLLPPSVSASRENLVAVTNYFRNEATPRGLHRVDVDLAKVVESTNTPDRYLRDFIFMANSGLYSFDIASHLTDGISYFRVASPTEPLRLGDLPPSVQSILMKCDAGPRSWRTSPTVPYQETLIW